MFDLSDWDITLWKYEVPSWLKGVEGKGGGDGYDVKGTKVDGDCAKVREFMTQAGLEGVITTGGGTNTT